MAAVGLMNGGFGKKGVPLPADFAPGVGRSG